MNKQSANMTSSITRLLAPLFGLIVMGFSGMAHAVPPPPPPPAKTPLAAAPPPPSGATPPPATPPLGTAPPPPPPPGTTSPAPTGPSELPPAPLAPPPPPPAPRQAPPSNQSPPPSNNGWSNGAVPLSWQASDPANAFMWPPRIDYEEGDVVPPGYDIKTRPSRGLFSGGLVTLLVPYGISFLVGGVVVLDGSDRRQEEYGPLLIPVFGPFVAMGMWDSTSEEGAFLMLANGFAQTAGAAMIATSLLMPDQYIERMATLPGKPQVFVGPGSATLRLHF